MLSMDKPFVKVEGAESLYPLAKSNSNPNQNQREISISTTSEDQQRLGRGAEGYINRILGKIGIRKREVTLAQKFLAEPETAFAQRDVYLFAKRAGIPVPDVFRPSTHGVVMSDLTENGTALVLSINDMKRSRLDELRSTNPKLMQLFDHTNISELETQATDISTRAMDAGLECSNEDSLFLIIKDGIPPRLILGDFGNVKKSDNPRGFNTSTFLVVCRSSQQSEEIEEDKSFWER